VNGSPTPTPADLAAPSVQAECRAPGYILPEAEPVASADAIRRALRHHAKGVTVITAGAATPVGFCATSFASLSLDPPLACFAVGLRAGSWPTVRTATHVMVHLLAAAQEPLARRFAAAPSPSAKFGPDTRWHRGVFGLPVLDEVLAWLALEPVERITTGDHVLVVGRVVAAHSRAAGGPLLHHHGRFVALSH
jgi:flavin reductase (DIM6/NTAB) family NADH-FMN oxidoreductase RutF